MLIIRPCIVLAAALVAAPALAQPIDPFPNPIPAADGAVTVAFSEFATLPDVDGEAARMMLLADEPGTRRLFVNDMRGILYGVSYDGRTVTPYLDLREEKWALSVQARNFEQGFQSFAFHPQFGRRGARGYGKFYTYVDTSDTTPDPDFRAGGAKRTHDTLLLEWTAKNPAAAIYDGGPPREMMRFEQPFANHNGGHIAFNPLAGPRDPDFGLLYVGSADGGSGGDPLEVSQNLNSLYGKILRIDPLGANSANGKYGIPASNPFVSNATDAERAGTRERTEARAAGSSGPGRPHEDARGEIYASGVRNPQRFFWDAKTRRMFVAEIGQNIVEEISPVTAGADLGWNDWEGSFVFVKGNISLDNPRGDRSLVYPVVEYGHADPLLQRGAAITGGVVYRGGSIRQLKDLMIFGDNPSGEIFYVHADRLPEGGQDAIRRVLFDHNGASKTLLQLIQEKNEAQGKKPAARADLRFGAGPDNKVFILNKRDGVIRLLVSGTSRNTSDGSRD